MFFLATFLFIVTSLDCLAWDARKHPIRQFTAALEVQGLTGKDRPTNKEILQRGLGPWFKLRWEDRRTGKFSYGAWSEFKIIRFEKSSERNTSGLLTNDLKLFPYAAYLNSSKLKFFAGPFAASLPWFTSKGPEEAKYSNAQHVGLHGGLYWLLPEFYERNNVLSFWLASPFYQSKLRSEKIDLNLLSMLEIRSTKKGQGPLFGIEYRKGSWEDIEQTFVAFRLGWALRF